MGKDFAGVIETPDTLGKPEPCRQHTQYCYDDICHCTTFVATSTCCYVNESLSHLIINKTPYQSDGYPRQPSSRMMLRQVVSLRGCSVDLPARSQQSLHDKREQVQHDPIKNSKLYLYHHTITN